MGKPKSYSELVVTPLYKALLSCKRWVCLKGEKKMKQKHLSPKLENLKPERHSLSISKRKKPSPLKNDQARKRTRQWLKLKGYKYQRAKRKKIKIKKIKGERNYWWIDTEWTKEWNKKGPSPPFTQFPLYLLYHLHNN